MRFFLSILGVIIFVVVVIVIIASSSSGKSSIKPINATNYSSFGTSVSQTSTGQLVGNNQRQAIRITVTSSERDIYFLNGYDQTISNSETFTNTSTAYSVFLGALQNAGFTTSKKTAQTNIFGVCPLGNTYQYELDSTTSTVFNNWSTSCYASDGNFGGNGPLIRQLFALQIPDYSTFVRPATTINTGIY
jgi:hypothetical protein